MIHYEPLMSVEGWFCPVCVLRSLFDTYSKHHIPNGPEDPVFVKVSLHGGKAQPHATSWKICRDIITNNTSSSY